MKERRIKQKSKALQRVRYSPAPKFITCQNCGFEMEFWSDSEETRCLFCGRKIFRKESTVH